MPHSILCTCPTLGEKITSVFISLSVDIKGKNLYNIVVNPKCRNFGIAKTVITNLLNNDKNLCLTKQYQKVIVSALPDNVKIHHALKTLNFNNLGFDGEYIVFEKSVINTAEKTL